ncbi:MAG: hypothetical protein ACOH14_05735 [Rhodoglobus sp.]
MSKIRMFLYRAGAVVADVAQSILQASGGGNGDPMRFDETGKRRNKAFAKNSGAKKSGTKNKWKRGRP